MTGGWGRAALMATAVLLCAPGKSAAQTPTQRPAPGAPAGERPVLLQDVGIDQKVHERLPLDLVFRNESGRAIRLGDYFRDRPVVLSLVYYECPMLCLQVLDGLVKALRTLPFDVGREFEVLTVSFDPAEQPGLAAKTKRTMLARYGRPGAEAGWHFLTGDEPAIHALTEAVGFRYVFDPRADQFAHGAAIVVLTPEGRISRYFFGIDYSTRDLRFALMEASEHRIGSVIDQVLLYCYHYDPASGRYGLVILNVLRLAGLATLLALGIFVVGSLRRERRAGRSDRGESAHVR
jgi:protein SCO1